MATPRVKARCSRYRSTSDIIRELAAYEGAAIRISDLSERLSDRGFGFMLLLFALPSAIPIPIPVVSMLTSLPLLFFAVQLCLGKERIWLPHWLADRHIPMISLRRLIQKSLPLLMRLEKVVKPRLDTITTRQFERLAGMLILLLAFLIALPVPLGNFPLGVAIVFLALAISERDGVMMITGWLFTVFALCFFAALVAGYGWILWQLVGGLF